MRGWRSCAGSWRRHHDDEKRREYGGDPRPASSARCSARWEGNPGENITSRGGRTLLSVPDDATLALRAKAEPTVRRGSPAGRVTRAQRRHSVITMAMAGAEEAQIAEALGISRGQVSKILNKVLDEWLERDAASVEKVRELQLARIDRLEQALWADATGAPETPGGPKRKPSLRAIAEIRKLEGLRSRIAGTEAPKKVELSGDVGVTFTPEQAAALDATWAASGGEAIEGTLVELGPGE